MIFSLFSFVRFRYSVYLCKLELKTYINNTQRNYGKQRKTLYRVHSANQTGMA